MMWTGHRAFARNLARVAMPKDADLRIWVTEWNISHRASGELGTWANALFIALMYDAMLADGRVALSHIHNLTGNHFAVLYNGKQPIPQVKHRQVMRDAAGFSLAPAGLVSALLAEVINGRTTAWRLRFGDTATLAAAHGPVPMRLGWLFGDDERPTGGFLINLDSEPVAVQIANISDSLTVETWTAKPTDYLIERPPDQRTTSADHSLLVLPPYSLAQLSFEPAETPRRARSMETPDSVSKNSSPLNPSSQNQ
jgi:hypothetical protein